MRTNTGRSRPTVAELGLEAAAFAPISTEFRPTSTDRGPSSASEPLHAYFAGWLWSSLWMSGRPMSVGARCGGDTPGAHPGRRCTTVRARDRQRAPPIRPRAGASDARRPLGHRRSPDRAIAATRPARRRSEKWARLRARGRVDGRVAGVGPWPLCWDPWSR